MITLTKDMAIKMAAYVREHWHPMWEDNIRPAEDNDWLC